MEHGRGLSRRTLMGSWLLALLGKRSAASTGIGLDPVGLSLRGFAPSTVFQRRYRMDASILLLGAPLFTRQAAGGAYASVEISRDPDATAMALQFAAGSDPARAHGLNRFGILREAVVIRGPGRGDATELSFAGLMTWSREESLEQGKKALASSTGGAEGLIARGRTNGSGGESKIQTWIDTLDLGPDCNWSNVYATLSRRSAARAANASAGKLCRRRHHIPARHARRGALPGHFGPPAILACGKTLLAGDAPARGTSRGTRGHDPRSGRRAPRRFSHHLCGWRRERHPDPHRIPSAIVSSPHVRSGARGQPTRHSLPVPVEEVPRRALDVFDDSSAMERRGGRRPFPHRRVLAQPHAALAREPGFHLPRRARALRFSRRSFVTGTVYRKGTARPLD